MPAAKPPGLATGGKPGCMSIHIYHCLKTCLKLVLRVRLLMAKRNNYILDESYLSNLEMFFY